MVYTFFNTKCIIYDEDVIICYADIIFDKKNINNLIKTKKDFNVNKILNGKKFGKKKISY